jgi:hypothetical protein
MSNQNNKKYHLRKRLFLGQNSENPDYVIAIVEDTKNVCDDCENESWKWSHIDLSIGNGYDQVSINFSMETHEDRTESIGKIRRLSKVLNEFREALETEVKSMNARKSQKQLRKNDGAIIEISTVA